MDIIHIQNIQLKNLKRMNPSIKEIFAILKKMELDMELDDEYNIYKHEFNHLNKSLNSIPSHLHNKIKLFKNEKYENAHAGIKKNLSSMELCFFKISSMIRSYLQIK